MALSARFGGVPFARPHIDDDDIAAVVGALRSGWITTGPLVRQFEERFAQRIGSRHAVAVNSATAALHLAMDAIGIGAGDEVIVPTFTFAATAEVVCYCGARPVLVDVLPDTLCLDPAAVEAAITRRTRAIIPVHLGGHPAEMDPILDLVKDRDIRVVEDAAHTLPARYRGREVGTLGDIGAFSFYATKTITTGEGGMLVTDDAAVAERARSMSLHGMSRDAWKRYTSSGSWRYDILAPGFKYNLTDMAAALGLSQLRKADWMWERRAAIAQRYSRAFAAVPELETPTSLSHVLHSWHLYVLRLHFDRTSLSRDVLIDKLAERDIRTSVHFIPIHKFTYYRSFLGLTDEMFPVASAQFERIVSLPIYPSMTDDEVDTVIAGVLEIIDEFRS